MMDVADLAQKLLVARVGAYVSSNPTGFPAADIVARWYQECWNAAIAAANAELQ